MKDSRQTSRRRVSRAGLVNQSVIVVPTVLKTNVL
jgi:hypothetical protein